MATPAEKIANALVRLKRLQDDGIVGIKHTDLSKTEKELLKKQGFIREVVKGWYISAPHTEVQGDSTSWFTSFWRFCARFLADRYGDNYCISAEQSLMLYTGNEAVPGQLIVRSPQGTNTPTKLLFGTSVFVMKSPLVETVDTELRGGLRIVTLPAAIVHYPASLFDREATNVRTALMMIRDASELLRILLDGGHSTIAGRLAGAYRNIGIPKIADDIVKTMKSAGYDVRETDPFSQPSPIPFNARERSPHVNRIRLMWHAMRQTVIDVFPAAPPMPIDTKKYLQEIKDLYTTDAYHSLSIEKYSVTPELIERLRSGQWNADKNSADRRQRDAMAARGYWQAFSAVQNSVVRILNGENAGLTVDSDHGDWYREMFAPSVAVGLLRPSDLAGYRSSQVYIGQSKHTPMHNSDVRDVMPLLFDLLENETQASVRAVLGHFVFVYIHPYMDGNGRMSRFLMNAMLVSGGYPWTVIPVEERNNYMQALECASVEQNIKPFAQLIANLTDAALRGKPMAQLMR